MNRRKFIAGLLASAAVPVAGLSVPLRGISATCVPLPYKDPSIVLVNLHANITESLRITKETVAAIIMNDCRRPLKETLHGLS